MTSHKVMMRTGVLIISVVCVGCVACEDAPRVDIATSVPPEHVARGEEGIGEPEQALPGSGSAPTFVSPASAELPIWTWVYEPGEDSNAGTSQDSVRVGIGTKEERECSFDESYAGVTCELINTGRAGYIAWRKDFDEEPFVGAGQMITDGTTLYVSHHSYISTGAQLSAYDLESGERAWRVNLEGIGETDHSKYRNETFLEFDPETHSVLVFGRESHGGYVERRDASTGKLLANKKLAMWVVNQHDRDPSIELETGSVRFDEGRHGRGGKRRSILDERGDEVARHIWTDSTPPRPSRLGRRDILSVIRAHRSELVSCAKLSESTHRLRSVWVKLSIAPNGKVSKVSSKTQSKEEGDDLIIACVLDRLKEMQFEKTQQMNSIPRYPIFL